VAGRRSFGAFSFSLGPRACQIDATERSDQSEQKKLYRNGTALQQLSIVLARLRGDRSVNEVCREHQISYALRTHHSSASRTSCSLRAKASGWPG
jgi:hypothetical protein